MLFRSYSDNVLRCDIELIAGTDGKRYATGLTYKENSFESITTTLIDTGRDRYDFDINKYIDMQELAYAFHQWLISPQQTEKKVKHYRFLRLMGQRAMSAINLGAPFN